MKEEKEKCGEIYRCGPGKFIFSCAYCTTTFDSKSNALTHIENHFTFEAATTATITKQLDLSTANFYSTLENIKIPSDSENAEASVFKGNFIQTLPIDVLHPENARKIPLKIEIQDSQMDPLLMGSSCIKKEPELIILNEQHEVTKSISPTLKLSKKRNRKKSVKSIDFKWGPVNPLTYVECDICKNKYRKQNIVQHMRKHANRTKQHKCPYCSKIYATRNLLYKHKRKHDEYKKYSCHICGGRFLHNLNLIAHLRTHTGEKPFKCTICSRTFAQQSTINYHMRLHTGEKPYQCEICQKRFATSSFYHVHKRRHLNVRPFKCDVCEKSFIDTVNLKKHQLVHTGERPFICDVCNKSFNINYRLRDHMKTHTGERQYKCRFCDVCFVNCSGRRQHERGVHKDKKRDIAFVVLQ